MSTYNGEKYLREQLDSIFAQQNVEIMLIVRDDGSTDSTVSILRQYEQKYSERIEIIAGNNIGWKKSFFELLIYANTNYSHSEYFAFADQDDIWLPEKLFHGIKNLKILKPGPNLYCSNLFYYKDGKNYGKIRKSLPIPDYKNCLIRNYAVGCTIVFNHTLLQLVANNIPDISVAHDFWLYQVSILCGYVYIDPEAYILYRQHDNNQIGIKSGRYEIWKQRLNNLTTNRHEHQRELQATELLRKYDKILSPNARAALLLIHNYRKSFLTKLKVICDSKFTTGIVSNDFWLKLRILFSSL